MRIGNCYCAGYFALVWGRRCGMGSKVERERVDAMHGQSREETLA
jgi:hypothetical protein